MKPTADEYSAIEEIYMKHEGEKDAFCAEWKKTPEAMRNAIVKTVMEANEIIEVTTNELEAAKAHEEQEVKERADIYSRYVKFVRETAVSLLDNDPDDEVAYKLVPMKEIVLYKARKGHDMNERDIEFMTDRISEE